MLRLSRGNLILGAICTLDMLSTLYLYLSSRIVEANPIMAYFLSMGVLWFVVVKLLSYVPALYMLEWYRKRNQSFGRLATRSAIGAYMLVYAVAFVGVNIL